MKPSRGKAEGGAPQFSQGPADPTRSTREPPGMRPLSRAESQGPRCEAGVIPLTDAFFHPCHEGLQKWFAFPGREDSMCLQFSPEL